MIMLYKIISNCTSIKVILKCILKMFHEGPVSRCHVSPAVTTLSHNQSSTAG